jgi:carbonic anhydrase
VHENASSEHAINGKKFAIEAHFVHKNSDGKLAVVGVMLDEGSSDSAAWGHLCSHSVPSKALMGLQPLIGGNYCQRVR